MTYFLENQTPRAADPFVEPAPAPFSKRSDRFAAGERLEDIEADRGTFFGDGDGYREEKRNDILRGLALQLGGTPEFTPHQQERFNELAPHRRQGVARRMLGRQGIEDPARLLGRVREAAKADPDAWAGVPLDLDELNAQLDEATRSDYADVQNIIRMTPPDAFATETLGALKSDFATPENVAAMFASVFIPGGPVARIAGEGVLASGIELAETDDRIRQAGVIGTRAPTYLERGALGFAFGAGAQGVLEGAGRIISGAADPSTRAATYQRTRNFIKAPAWKNGNVSKSEAEGAVQATEEALAALDPSEIPPPPRPSIPAIEPLTAAVIRQESGGNPLAVSHAGAVGLMQVMPRTARQPGFGVPSLFQIARDLGQSVPDETDETLQLLLRNEEVNRAFGTQYLTAMTSRYNDLDAALVAYNAGPGVADAWLKRGKQSTDLPAETREYIRRVRGFLDRPSDTGPRVLDQDTIVTPTGAAHPVSYELVELGDLITSHQGGAINPAFPVELQPRDRSRSASEAQIEAIANRLEPRLLGRNASAADGAPVIGADNVVEAGNGRIDALRRVYESKPDREDAYRAFLKSEGLDTEGFTQPVLIRRRTGGDLAERARFAQEANARTTAASSASERARTDAAALDDNDLALFQGGDLASPANRDFITAALSRFPESERPAFQTSSGGLSAAGEQRLSELVLARAYDDRAVLELALEAPDAISRTAINALRDAAPEAARLRANIANGIVPDALDISGDIAATVNRVQQARTTNTPIRDILDQRDLLSADPDGLDEALTRIFHADDDLTRLASRKQVSTRLNALLRGLNGERADTGLFGDDFRLSAGQIARDVLQAEGITPPPLRSQPPVLTDPTPTPARPQPTSPEGATAEAKTTPAASAASRGTTPEERRAALQLDDIQATLARDPDFGTTVIDEHTGQTVNDVLADIDADEDLSALLKICTLGGRA